MNPQTITKWKVAGGRIDHDSVFVGASTTSNTSGNITEGINKIIGGVFSAIGNPGEAGAQFKNSISSLVSAAFDAILGNSSAGSHTSKKYFIVPYGTAFYRVDVRMYKYNVSAKGFKDHFDSVTVVYASRGILDVKDLREGELLAYASEMYDGDPVKIKNFLNQFIELYRIAREATSGTRASAFRAPVESKSDSSVPSKPHKKHHHHHSKPHKKHHSDNNSEYTEDRVFRVAPLQKSEIVPHSVRVTSSGFDFQTRLDFSERRPTRCATDRFNPTSPGDKPTNGVLHPAIVTESVTASIHIDKLNIQVEKNTTKLVVDAQNKNIHLWAPNQTIRWCFDENSFSQKYNNPQHVMNTVSDLIKTALNNWEFVPLTFQYSINNPHFRVVMHMNDDCDGKGCTLASAFFPQQITSLDLYPILFSKNFTYADVVNTLEHEFGHVFGLRHYFALTEESFRAAKIFGSHKPQTIMNYGDKSVLTTDDKDDLKTLYEKAWDGSLTAIGGVQIKFISLV